MGQSKRMDKKEQTRYSLGKQRQNGRAIVVQRVEWDNRKESWWQGLSKA